MERILNAIGLGLLALCFVIALGRIVWKQSERASEDGQQIVEIRLAHWQLEGGIREALDALAAEYMKLHPHVRISQIPIPERIYKNWLLTQLVGGTAPDIIQIGGMGVSEERLARFFLPLTESAQVANPYNKGTSLEGLPLRDTFFDGMMGGFNSALLEYYGIPLSAFTLRVYINMNLLHEITGSDRLPTTYREFIDLCNQASAFGEKTGQPIIPIAGSRYNSPMLMSNLFASQTQRLSRELGPPGTFQIEQVRFSSSFVDDEWTLDSPQIRSGLKILREVGQKMQPGFMQVSRDDASFYFMQGKALMIATGSWDSSSISQQARFPFRAFRIPMPDQDDPEFGKYVLGFTSEAGLNAGIALGVTKASKHPAAAIDFLLFVSSQRMNQKFTDISGWIPSVVGVSPSERTADFMILTDGFTSGFTLTPPGRPDISRVVNNAFHRLIAPEGSVEEFIETIRPHFLKAHATDSDRNLLGLQSALQRMDVQMAGTSGMVAADPTDQAAAHRLDMIIASSNSQELARNNLRFVTEKIKRRLQNKAD
jgi:raffinose/stachyose/melibiose transport system substrate-binding protein